MTVKELIEELQKLPPDTLVILQIDSEGNGFSPLEGLWNGNYRADSTWSGQMGLSELTEEDREQGYTAADILEGVTAVALYPVN